MAPEDRRAAIIAATVPLLREHGMAVSTRQIAEAAGVAEGTIFGVFPDKNSLLRAAVMKAFDPRPALGAFAAISRELDLRTRMREVASMLRAGMLANANLFSAPKEAMAEDEEFREQMMEGRKLMMDAITAVIEPDRDQLRRSPRSAAHMLFLLLATTVHRGFGHGEPTDDMDDDEIVSVLLDGLLVRPAPQPATESGS